MLLEAHSAELLKRISPKVVYGAIVLSAVLGSLSDPLPRNVTVIVTVFFSLQGISLANAYAETIRDDMANHGFTPWRESWRAILAPSWVMASTALPITFFGLATLGLITSKAALGATRAALIVLLVFFGFVARRMSGAGVLRSVWAGTLAALLGYAVIQIKVWAKYLPEVGPGP